MKFLFCASRTSKMTKYDPTYDCSISQSTQEVGDQLFEFYAIPQTRDVRVSIEYERKDLKCGYMYESWDFDPPNIESGSTDMGNIAFDIIMHTLQSLFPMSTFRVLCKAS